MQIVDIGRFRDFSDLGAEGREVGHRRLPFGLAERNETHGRGDKIAGEGLQVH